MFCGECGNKLADSVKFCPNCGTKVNGIENPARRVPEEAPGLPAGMTRSPDGRIWWSFRNKKDECMCYLGESTFAVMYEAKEKKKPSAMGMFVLDIAAAHSDEYLYPELPSELLDPGTEAPRVTVNGSEYYHTPLEFRYVTALKEDRKRGNIKLYGTSGWWTLSFTPEQYDFALEYLLAHCPNIRKRT